jgi:2-dehydro-3-deoxygluconokinase
MRAVLMGEAMLELTQTGPLWRLAYGGDTLNTAIHIARTGIDTAYLTALGSDPFSHQMLQAWQAEGLDTSLVLEAPGHHPGLYAISVDPRGERSFTYWRENSAARRLFSCTDIEKALVAAAQADLFAYSLISLAVMSPADRERIHTLATRVRQRGGKVAFDGNFRPRLWASAEEARSARDKAVACADIGLPTLEDELALGGVGDAHAVLAHWTKLGCRETVVKLGSSGCLLPDGQLLPPPKVLQPVDTSGAGDAFNAGYLAARLRGSTIQAAALAGHELAGWCVMRHGAIPAVDQR